MHRCILWMVCFGVFLHTAFELVSSVSDIKNLQIFFNMLVQDDNRISCTRCDSLGILRLGVAPDSVNSMVHPSIYRR